MTFEPHRKIGTYFKNIIICKPILSMLLCVYVVKKIRLVTTLLRYQIFNLSNMENATDFLTLFPY